MHFVINKLNLSKLLRRLSAIAADKKTTQNPILGNVLFLANNEGLTLVARDDNSSLTLGCLDVEVKSPGKTTVSARLLNDICRSLSDDDVVEVKQNLSKLHIISGRSRFSLNTLPAEEFPSLEMDSEVMRFSLPGKGLKRLFDKTSFAMANQDARYFLNGMLFEVRDERLYLVAADGHRLIAGNMGLDISKDVAIRVILPRKSVVDLMKFIADSDESLEVAISIKHMKVTSGNMTFLSGLLSGAFPDYEKAIPSLFSEEVMASKADVKSAILRASAIFNEKQKLVRVRLEPGKMMVVANNKDADNIEEDFDVEYSGGVLNTNFNAKYLLDYLSFVESNSIRLRFAKDASAGVVIEGDKDINYVLMPMRV